MWLRVYQRGIKVPLAGFTEVFSVHEPRDYATMCDCHDTTRHVSTVTCLVVDYMSCDLQWRRQYRLTNIQLKRPIQLRCDAHKTINNSVVFSLYFLQKYFQNMFETTISHSSPTYFDPSCGHLNLRLYNRKGLHSTMELKRSSSWFSQFTFFFLQITFFLQGFVFSQSQIRLENNHIFFSTNSLIRYYITINYLTS